MRISNKPFGVRKTVLKSKEAKKKYFLAYEGVQTEVIYFNGVCANKNAKLLTINLQFFLQ